MGLDERRALFSRITSRTEPQSKLASPSWTHRLTIRRPADIYAAPVTEHVPSSHSAAAIITQGFANIASSNLCDSNI